MNPLPSSNISKLIMELARPIRAILPHLSHTDPCLAQIRQEPQHRRTRLNPLNNPRPPRSSGSWRAQLVVALSGLVFMALLLLVFRPQARDGQYYQPWPSERLMQTVALEDLRDAPWETLSNLHIQPPALDAFRAMIVAIAPDGDIAAAQHFVDGFLLLLGAVAYAAMGLLVFRWAGELAGRRIAVVATVAVLLHPATIFYATTLDTTFVSSLMTLALFHSLWRARHGGVCVAMIAAVIYVVLFYTRSLYQWPFPFIFAGALALRGASRRSVTVFLLITVAATAPYMVKRHSDFGVWTTSTFAGLNLVVSTGLEDSEAYLHLLDEEPLVTGPPDGRELPLVLTRTRMFGGYPNYNHWRYLEEYHRMTGKWADYVSTVPVAELTRRYLFNAWLFIQPSSRYTGHAIVDHLPWRRVADRLTAFPLIFVTWGAGLWFSLAAARGRGELLAQLGLMLPAAIMVGLIIFCEGSETMRYKFFIEPTSILFLVVWTARVVPVLKNMDTLPDNGTIL